MIWLHFPENFLDVKWIVQKKNSVKSTPAFYMVYVHTCLVEKAFAVFDHSFLPFRIGYPISRLGGRSK